MESGQGAPPAQGQEVNFQEAYPPTNPQQGIPVAQYPPANMAPSQYSNPPPMQYQPQPPGGYQYPYQAVPAPTAYVQPGYVVINDGGFYFGSQSATCPTCMAVVQTRTQRSPSAAAWISFILLLLLFAFIWLLPLCCIPFCIPSCYNVKHYCPRCGTLLGERRG